MEDRPAAQVHYVAGVLRLKKGIDEALDLIKKSGIGKPTDAIPPEWTDHWQKMLKEATNVVCGGVSHDEAMGEVNHVIAEVLISSFMKKK